MKIKWNPKNIQVTDHAIDRYIKRSKTKGRIKAEEKIISIIKQATVSSIIPVRGNGTIVLAPKKGHFIVNATKGKTTVITYIDREENYCE